MQVIQSPNNRFMKKKICIILAACLLSCPLSEAQALSSLLVFSDPESAAVAGASVAREANAFAVDNNAAAMSLSEKTFAAGASYSLWAPGSADSQNIGFGAFVRVGNRIGIGLSGKYLMDRPMDITSASGGITGHFTPAELAGNLAVSVQIIDGLSLAVTGKVMNSSISEGLSGTAFGADISVSWQRRSVSAGAALCNAGTRISYGGDSSYSLPMLVKAGAAWKSGFGLTVNAEADYLFSGAFMAGAGLEYSICDIGFVRAGYHYGDRSEGLSSFASAGIGIRLAGFSLDATWLTGSETLKNTLMFGIGYWF